MIAALTALSLALVPVATDNVFPPPGSVASAMPDQEGMPCHPNCDKQDNSKDSISCAMKCMSVFAAILPLAMPFPAMIKAVPVAQPDKILRGLVRSPPLHPPPV